MRQNRLSCSTGTRWRQCKETPVARRRDDEDEPQRECEGLKEGLENTTGCGSIETAEARGRGGRDTLVATGRPSRQKTRRLRWRDMHVIVYLDIWSGLLFDALC